MNFDGGFQIKVSKNNIPLTARGPVLTSDTSGNIYMEYIGKGGKNLWMAYCEAGNGNFQTWLGNNPVKAEGGKTMETRDRPALAFFPNWPVLAYIDHSSGKLMETAYIDAAWLAPSEVTGFQGINMSWSQPILLTPGLTMYLVAIDEQGNPWYSVKTLVASVGDGEINGYMTERTEATMVNRTEEEIAAQANVSYWVLSMYGDQIYLLGIQNNFIFIYSKILNVEKWGSLPPPPFDFTWFYKGSVQIPVSMAPWLSAVPIVAPPGGESYTGFLYTSSKSDHNDRLYFIALDLNSLNFIMETSSELGSGEDGRFTTKTVAGSLYQLISDNQSGIQYYAYAAYKGASNSTLYLTAGW